LAVIADFWARVMAEFQPHWRDVISHIAADADERRDQAAYNTGSIAEDEACSLLALAAFISAKTVVEIGTFIGTSTLAMAAAPTVTHVYTCDVSNDCLPATNRVHTYPHKTSTQMLDDVVRLGVRADLCFFDGCVNTEDVPLLAKVTTPETVYAVHDYNYGPKIRKNGARETVPRKGIGNIQLLQPYLRNHVIVPPQDGQLIAALVPRSLL
jgi:predicted O-methyltransferase YrrM